MTRNWCKYGFVLLAGAMVPGLQAFAADTSKDDTLEEIIVTAQNRVENVQRVPIAIQVVGAEKLAEVGFGGLNDIAKVAPSVQIINDNNALRVTVRGVGSNTNGESDDTSVVVNVDGEYINRGQVLSASMFDIERIEVLKGPQGTLQGRNSTGGALNIVSRKPGDKFAVNGTVGVGNYGATSAEAGVDLPLGSIAAVRVAGIYNDHDGYYSHPDNINFVTQGVLTPASKSGIERNAAGRVSLRLDPTDTLKINVATEYSKKYYVNTGIDTVDLHAANNAPAGPGCNAPGYVNIAPLWENAPATYTDPVSGYTGPFSACVPMNTNFLAGKDRKASFAQPWSGVGGYHFDSQATRASASYTFSPAATLTYVGGYRSSGQTGEQGLPVTYKTITFKSDVSTQSHELRLSGEVGKVKYQGGLFHFDEKLDSDAGFALDGFFLSLIHI